MGARLVRPWRALRVYMLRRELAAAEHYAAALQRAADAQRRAIEPLRVRLALAEAT